MQKQYSCHVVLEQPGFWALELKPLAKPDLPVCEKQRKATVPPSLQQFIRGQGGLNPGYNRGQWRHELAMIRDSGRQGLQPGVLNYAARKTFEEMADVCQEAGYIPIAEVDVLLWALSKDVEATLTGEKRNRVYGHSGMEYAVSLLDMERWESLLPQERETA